MGKNFMEKFARFVGIEEEQISEPQDREELVQDEAKEFLYPQRKKGAVVALHTQKQMKVVVMEPQSFEEVQAIADHLKNRRPTIVNLQTIDKEIGKRIVDFMSGTVYALDGGMKRIGDCIFLFTPENVDIAADLKQNYQNVPRFPWDK